MKIDGMITEFAHKFNTFIEIIIKMFVSNYL